MVHMGRAGLCVGMAVAALFSGAAAQPRPRTGTEATSVHRTSSTPARPRFGAGGDDALRSYGPDVPADPAPHRWDRRLRRPHRARASTVGSASRRARSTAACARSALPQQRQLVTLLATLRLGPRPATACRRRRDAWRRRVDPDAVTDDPITISVTDHQARRIDLSDPSLGEISGLVGTLVSDVTLSVPATTRCTTPAAPGRRARP